MSVKKAADDMTGAEKSAVKYRQGLDTIGGAAGKLGLVAAAGLGAAVVASADFDQAMSNVQAATGESTQAMNDLREAALQAGADTAFSASEAAAGIENLAKAGVSTADILGGGLSGALDLAAAGGLDVATAAEAAATAMTQFSLSGEDVPHIADLLAAGAGKAQGEVTDLSMALNQAGLVAGQMGLSIEETTGTLAAFASAGLLGSDAGTSLKTMLLRLANPSQESADAMEALGINAYDASGNLVTMTELAGQLAVAFEGKSQAERDAALATIFGSDAIRAANVLYSQGAAGIADWTDKVNDSGYAAETAATKLDNLKGDIEALMGSLETALIGTGDGAQGPLRTLVQEATDVVNAFNELPPAAKNVTAALLAITAVTGGGLWFGAKVIGGIASTRQALTDLGVSAKTTGRALSVLKGGFALGAAVLTLAAIDSQLDKIGAHDFSDMDLDRQLEAFADGEVSGNLDQIGNKLSLIQAESKGMTAMDEMWGWLPGVSSDADEAATNIEKIDQALAAMVEGGESDQASAAFDQIKAQAEATGVSTESLTKSFDAYNLALHNAGEGGAVLSDGLILQSAVVENSALAALRASAKTKGLGQSMDQASDAGARMAARMKRQQEALVASRKAADETAQQFVGLGNSLDNAKVSLSGWIRQLARQAEALHNFRVNAEKAAKKGLDEGLIASLQEMGPAGALRMKQLANATDEQIARANAAWKRGQREIERYVDAIGGIPPSVTTTVNARTEDAMAKLYALNRIKLDDKTIYVHTVRTGGDGDFVSGGIRKAAGGPVYGPGTGTSDSIPALLSNGEYVIKAAAVAQYGRHLFDELNAQRYAHGGYVALNGGGSSTVSVNLNGMQVTGTLQTPWGPAAIEGVAREAAKSEITRHQTMRRNSRGYGS